MNNPQHTAERPLGKEHIPIYPPKFIAIRIVQLVLAVLILALAAYGVSLVAFDGNCFILAVAIMTLIASVYHMVAHWSVPALYNYWAILGLDILLVVMWLCSFALLAARVAATYAYVDDYYSSYSYYGSRSGLSATANALLITQALAASLGAVEFVLYIVSLVIHSIRLHRHRAAGLHCMPPTSPTNPSSHPPGGAAPYPGGPMYQTHPPHQQHQQQQQHGYPPQPQQGYMAPMAMPMPMQMHPMPDQQQMMPMPQHQHQQYQQHQHQQPQQQQAPPQAGFYAPPSPVTQPSQSPPPLQPIAPQRTGQSQAPLPGGAQQQQQYVQGQRVEEGQLPPQLPGDEHR